MRISSYFYTCPFLNHSYYTPYYLSMRSLPQNNPISVTTKRIAYQTPALITDLRIPILQGIKNISVQNAINNSVNEDASEFKREMETAAQDYADKARQEGKPIKPYVISSIYEVPYNRNNIISIAMVYHENIGGNNSYIKVPYNFNLITGKALALEDIFQPGINYKALIDREIRKQISAHRESYAPGTLERFKGVAADQPFYLENGNLVVFFGFNEIAPTEPQIPVFKIPLSSFGNAVKPTVLRSI
ncbi:hypothetical protein HNQ80_002683 [Anaerosolibacter carboniphilus]|uniref:DUF3298 domain-containing protein n=1 Tax=Anaerosolibacter carboniphilus TaxID=1417629 RepID=A0A841L2G1_9FIRM|nr:DUF3298 and DUF4163 domain-containing protein [Anaerosolibacter carboniphilus]MBB6216579.1 hypothetical protein [Anaerosolibacter carboniphilus]